MAEIIPWAALIAALASIIAVIYGAWASRERAATEVEIIAGLRAELDEVIKNNRSLRARVRALENVNSNILTAFEEQRRGSKLNVKQLRDAGMTPLWEPITMNWRGDDSDSGMYVPEDKD